MDERARADAAGEDHHVGARELVERRVDVDAEESVVGPHDAALVTDEGDVDARHALEDLVGPDAVQCGELWEQGNRDRGHGGSFRRLGGSLGAWCPRRQRGCAPARSRRTPVTVRAMDVRIGVTQAPRELTVEIPDEERQDTEKLVDAALAGAVDVLWLRDKRGRRVGVPAAKIAYVELGVNDGDRRIGFGG